MSNTKKEILLVLKYTKPESISMTNEVIDVIIEEAEKTESFRDGWRLCYRFLEYLVIPEINRSSDNLEYKIYYNDKLIARK